MSIFKPKSKKKKVDSDSTFIKKHRPYDRLFSMAPIMMNDGVNICAEACACCWDTPLPDSYEERSIYIGKRTKTGHGSVIEHSNVVFYMYIRPDQATDLVEFLDLKHFVNTKVVMDPESHGWHMLIGGSWRGYGDIIRNATNMENTVLVDLIERIYSYMPSDAFNDYINMGLLDKERFANVDYTDTIRTMQKYRNCNPHINKSSGLTIVSCDDIDTILQNLIDRCDKPWLFTYQDIFRMCSITIKIENVSRIITQQLTRHRVAITQESQRYVDYTGAIFNSPAKFKDQYKPNHEYDIEFAGIKHKMNLQEIGDAINTIYGQLHDKQKNGEFALAKEDARGYLANNTQSKLYMTFTFYQFIWFLNLREPKAAQAENRIIGRTLGSWFRRMVFGYEHSNFSSEEEWMKFLYRAIEPAALTCDPEYENVFLSNLEYVEGGAPNRSEIGTEPISDAELEKIYANTIEKEDEEAAAAQPSDE